jgi:UDP-N-acetylglucosamine transferase subunit ALG13
MLPFERMVRAVDEWAKDNPQEEVFLQIGDTRYEPQHAPFARIIPITEYRSRLRECDLFVAHCGMGAILQALEERKQLLMLPRIREWGEHTTDHQLHTALRFAYLPGLKVVDDVVALKEEMSGLLETPLFPGDAISKDASPNLLTGVRTFLSRI